MICPICNNEFIPDKLHPRQKFCNIKCYKKSNDWKGVCIKSDNKNSRKQYQKKYKKLEKYKLKQKEYSKKEIAKEYKKNYEKNVRSKTEKRINYMIKYRQDNKIYRNEYDKNRLSIDIDFKLKCMLRKRLYSAFTSKNVNKPHKAMDLIGCTIPELKSHLEKQFKPTMSWDNYGFYGWHVDHIRPCASFNLTDPEQQKQCFHYTNLQPLWAIDNMRKGSKIA